MNAPEEKDPVWELLKKSPPAKASAFFSRNVVREVRKMKAERRETGLFRAALLSWFRQPVYAIVAASLAAALVAIAVLKSGAPASSSGAVAPEVAQAAPAAVEDSLDSYDATREIGNIEYLGQLMAVADPASLDDDALADLFF